jgi:exoribonuclease-2
VLRENAVRLNGVPLVVRVPSLPETTPPGARVRLAVRQIDLLQRSVDCTYLETVDERAAALEDDAGPSQKA